MKFKINVDRNAAIKIGNEDFGDQIIDMPLADIPQNLREELTKIPQYQYKEGNPIEINAYISGNKCSGEPKIIIDKATPEAVIELLQTRLAIKKYREEKLKIAVEKLIERVISVNEDELENWPTWEFDAEVKENAFKNEKFASKIEAFRKKRIEEEDRRRQEGEDRRRQEREDRLREYEKQTAKLKDWALTHGSEVLKMMIEMKTGDWIDLANIEYKEEHAPEGYTCGSYDGVKRKQPTLKDLTEFKKLREIIEKSNGMLSSPDILYVMSNEYSDEENDVIYENGFSVIVVKVHGLITDDWSWYSKPIENEG